MSLTQTLAMIGFAIGLCAAVYLREIRHRPLRDWSGFILAATAFALIAGGHAHPPGHLPLPLDTIIALAVALLVAAEILAFYASLAK